jgi:thiamine biosynthesis lipoprotein
MGSIATVCAYGESTAHIDDAISKVIAEFGRLDALLSVFNSASAISRLNSSAGITPVHVSQEVCGILESSRSFNKQTMGLFDVTVEPLMRLWGFRGESREKNPTDREIVNALAAVGMCHLSIDSNRQEVFLDRKGASLDLGGIAVGHAVDRAVGILRSSGIESAFVNHAGDAYALGAPDEQDGWMAAVPHPSQAGLIVHKEVLTNRALSTSADNERFVTIDDVRYGHIMDVRSGRPEHGPACIAVMAPTAMQADALSTAAFCRPDVLATVPETSYFLMERPNDGARVQPKGRT